MSIDPRTYYFQTLANEKWPTDFSAVKQEVKQEFGLEGTLKGKYFTAYTTSVWDKGIKNLPSYTIETIQVVICDSFALIKAAFELVLVHWMCDGYTNFFFCATNLVLADSLRIASIFTGIVLPFTRDFAEALHIGNIDLPLSNPKETAAEAEEKAKKRKAEKDAALKAEEEKKAATEKAERDAAEAAEKAKREAADLEAADKAKKEAADKAQREAADKEAAEKAQKEAADKEAAEKAQKEAADKEAAEKAQKEAADKEAAEKAQRESEVPAQSAAKEGAVQTSSEGSAKVAGDETPKSDASVDGEDEEDKSDVENGVAPIQRPVDANLDAVSASMDNM